MKCTALCLCCLLAATAYGQMIWNCVTDSAGWVPRSGHASAVFDSKMWVMGGVGRYPWWNDVWYSSGGVDWTQATESAGWLSRHSHTSMVFDGRMWVMGGHTIGPGGGSFWNDCWYSSDGVDWTQATDSADWLRRGGHTSLAFDGKMWVMGGTRRYLSSNDVWHSSDGVDWTRATDSAGWPPRGGHASLVFGDKMWVMGGKLYYGPELNDVWYSSDGVNWTQATDSAGWSPRYGHTSLVFADKMWVMGGSDYARDSNDVWNSLGVDIEEMPGAEAPAANAATIVRSVLMVPAGQNAALLDITGRRVTDLKPRDNDIRHVAPGIYFVRQKEGERTTKVVVQN